MKRFVFTFIVLLCCLGCEQHTVIDNKLITVDAFSSINHFEYSGHKYILFTLERTLPATSANIVHDPDCPCHKKDTVYIKVPVKSTGSNDVNITYRERTREDDILDFLRDKLLISR